MFYKKEKYGFQYFTSDIFHDDLFVHAFSSRIYKDHSDFALMDKNDYENKQVKYNRQLFLEAFGIKKESLVIPEQTHSSNIKIVKNTLQDLSDTDGIIICDEGITGMLFFADCTPVILFSGKHRVFSMLHAGWKGTASNIASKAVDIMKNNFGINPIDIKAAIGPCISQCCFEINSDVADKLKNSLSKNYDGIIHKQNNKIYAHLKLINKLQLIEKGIRDIDIMEYCTVCQNDLFFSYRKENSTAKRHAIMAQLKNK